MEAIKRNIDLAPLHNPPNIMGIEACAEILPGVPQVAVFDTAFHQTMPDYAYIYGLPYELYKEHGIPDTDFTAPPIDVAQELLPSWASPWKELKIITCHLGNGASITAVRAVSLSGPAWALLPGRLIMGTRFEDIDPAIIIHMLNYLGMTADEVNKMLNKVGVYGISRSAATFAIWSRQRRATGAQPLPEVSYHRVVKYIGAYAAVMNGADIIVFTAGRGKFDVAREEV